MTIDKPEDAKAFAKEFGATYPMYRDESMAVVKAFRVFAIPFNAVISHEGKILYAETGGDVAVIKKHALAALEAAKKAAAESAKKKSER